MLNLLRKRWWKYFSVAVLLLVLLAGLYFPLSPGITSVSPDRATSGGPVSFTIETYNTHFEAGNTPAVYLQNKQLILCASQVAIAGERGLTATFDLPAGLGGDKQQEFNIVVDDNTHGTFFLDAIFVKGTGQPTPIANCIEKIEVKSAAYFNYPHRTMLYESIRNLFFHVPMWFAMMLLLTFCFGSNIAYLRTNKPIYDIFAKESAVVAMLFGALGIVTGMMWAKFTWGAFWTNDPKLNGAAVGMLTYFAYFVLRGSLTQREQRAKVTAVYGIFAFIIFIVFIFVLPRLSDSLHPGNGGNPAFNVYDLNNSMRPIFYSAVIGFTGIGYWIMSLRIRYTILQQQLEEQSTDKPYENLVS